MNGLGEIIVLNKETRELYIQYDYEFFLNRDISIHEYSKEDISLIYTSYEETKKELSKKIKENKTQTLFHIDGGIRKSHSGGSLPSRFELDETRSGGIIDFKGEGQVWAYFDLWKKHEKRKLFKERFWDFTFKIGSLLGFILTIIKIIEVFKNG